MDVVVTLLIALDAYEIYISHIISVTVDLTPDNPFFHL